MDSNDAAYHTAPLRHLVKQVLHKDTTLADRVRQLRYKRRKTKTVLPEVEVGGVLLEEAEQPAGQVQEVGT